MLLKGAVKRSSIPPVRTTVHTNLSPKRSFSKTLFKPAEFENVGVFVWTENILERSFSKTMTSRWSRDFPTCCMLSYLCLLGYNVLFSGIVFASESLRKGKSPVCFIFYWFDWIFIGAVTNSQIIPKPLYLDNPPPKSSLPPIQPFKRHVHVPNQSREKHVSGHSGTAEGESNSDSIRLVLKGKLSEVWFSFEIEC